MLSEIGYDYVENSLRNFKTFLHTPARMHINATHTHTPHTKHPKYALHTYIIDIIYIN